jgi:hypothetical protein
MAMYSSPLWDLTDRCIECFYVAWRKSIRRLFDLPYRTHSRLLHLICNDLPIASQLLVRFHKFILSLQNTSNSLTRLCQQLALSGSHSAVSNSMSALSSRLHISRLDMLDLDSSTVYKALFSMHLDLLDDDTAVHALLLKDLINMKFDAITSNEYNLSEICHSINYYCVL